MTRAIAILLAAATIAGIAAPAAAQTRYYARERLQGIASATTTRPAKTKSTCGVPAAGKWVHTAAATPYGTVTGSTQAETLAKAKAYCEAYSVTACEAWYYVGESPLTMNVVGRGGGPESTSSFGYFASTCVVNP